MVPRVVVSLRVAQIICFLPSTMDTTPIRFGESVIWCKKIQALELRHPSKKCYLCLKTDEGIYTTCETSYAQAIAWRQHVLDDLRTIPDFATPKKFEKLIGVPLKTPVDPEDTTEQEGSDAPEPPVVHTKSDFCGDEDFYVSD